MRPPKYQFDQRTWGHLLSVLGDKSRVHGLLGEDHIFPEEWRPAPVASSQPMTERLVDLLGVLEEHLCLLAEQSEELDSRSYAEQAEGEMVATLICIREIWHRFPELWNRRQD